MTSKRIAYKTPSSLRSLAWRTWLTSWALTAEQSTPSKSDHCCDVSFSRSTLNSSHPMIHRKVKLKADCPKNCWELVANLRLTFILSPHYLLEYFTWVLATLWSSLISRSQLSGPIDSHQLAQPNCYLFHLLISCASAYLLFHWRWAYCYLSLPLLHVIMLLLLILSESYRWRKFTCFWRTYSSSNCLLPRVRAEPVLLYKKFLEVLLIYKSLDITAHNY